jgi:hypothetical protein
MFEMPDEDAEVIMSRIVELVHKHKTIPDVVKELTAEYGEGAILTGMTVQKVIDRNDRAAQNEEASRGFSDPAFIFGEALGMSIGEATEVCEAVGKLALDSPKWKAVLAAVGGMFGERAVYAGAFLLYMYTRAEGEPAKKYNYGNG